ncbi:unnamed protein product [Auanema sp. JU1783]|nr:unnamed protein product [Auanema sp. JU1783]
MEEEITDLKNFVDEFFDKNPGSKEEDLLLALEKRFSLLMEEIDRREIASDSKLYNLIVGQIYNASPKYDARAEYHLSKAVKLDMNLVLAWLELAVLMSKKKDPDFAIYCCEKSLEHQRTCKALFMLSYLLRMKATQQSNVSNNEKNELFRKSMACGVEAVAIDPNCGKAHVYLGNSYFVHFVRSNSSFQVLENAAECYRRALKCDTEFRNPDLHLNYSEVLKYKQDYAGALDHLRLARRFDPSATPKEKYENLVTFLNNIHSAIEKKGRIKPRKYQETLESLKGWETKLFAKKHIGDSRVICSFSDLKVGENSQKTLVVSVVATLSHEEQIPVTMVVMDSTGCSFAVMIYNARSSFGFIIGDVVEIKNPSVVLSENLKISDTKIITELKMIHVSNPTQLTRNGVSIQAASVAPTSFTLTDS